MKKSGPQNFGMGETTNELGIDRKVLWESFIISDVGSVLVSLSVR